MMLPRHYLLSLCLAAVLSGSALAAEGESGILVLGGTRGVGLETVKLLLDRGDAVTVMVRPTSDLTALNATNAKRVTGDALDRDSVAAAFAAGEYRAVVSTLSGKGKDGQMADAEGNINGIDAAVAAGVDRFVLVSSIGVGDSKDALPWIARFMLRSFLEAKGRGEEHLFATGLDYTVIRPGNLNNDAASGRGILTEDRSAGGSISRSEVARLVVDSLDRPETFGKVYAAIETE